METRLTLRPGRPRTRKLVEKYGERLLRVGYVYDAAQHRRLKTVELVVESVPWIARPRRVRRHDGDIVHVRIGYEETEQRARARNLGAVWRKPQRLWETTYRDRRRLGIVDRIVREDGGETSGGRSLPAYGAIQMQMVQSTDGWF